MTAKTIYLTTLDDFEWHPSNQRLLATINEISKKPCNELPGNEYMTLVEVKGRTKTMFFRYKHAGSCGSGYLYFPCDEHGSDLSESELGHLSDIHLFMFYKT